MNCPRCKKVTTEFEDRMYRMCGECWLVRPEYDPKIPVGGWAKAKVRHNSMELSVHSKDVLQPLTKSGRPNRHFVQAYGTQSYQKNYKMSKEQVLKTAE